MSYLSINSQNCNNVIYQNSYANPQKRYGVSFKQQPDSFEYTTKKKPKPKEMSKKTKTILGVSCALFVALGAFALAKCNFSKAKQLAENIDFKEAKNIEEAIEFGKKNLGINKYKGFENSDLEVINWVNKGLVETNNKTKGKSIMPKDIIYKVLDDKKVMAEVGTNSKKLYINKDYITNIDDSLKKITENVDNKTFKQFKSSDVENIIDALEKFKKGELTSLEDKLKLKNNLSFIAEELDSSDTLKIHRILQDEQSRQKLIDSGILQGDTISTPLSRFKINEITEGLLPHKERSAFRTIFHELGHLKNSSIKHLNNSTGQQNYSQKLKNWKNNTKNLDIAFRVSDYASTSPSEFLAEVYADLLDGVKFDDDVLKLYKELGGVVFN